MPRHPRSFPCCSSFLPAVVVAFLLAGCGGDRPGPGPDERAEDDVTAERPPLECEEQGYPCRWSDVDADVARASRELGDAGMDRLLVEGPEPALRWLEERDDVAAAGRVDEDVWFRLEGGRRIWLLSDRPADVYRRRAGVADRSAGPPAVGPAAPGTGPAARRPRGMNLLAASLAPRPLLDLMPRAMDAAVGALTADPTYHVAGRDRTEDDAIDQRDRRRALIITPFEFDHSESLRKGAELARILKRDAGFEVTRRANATADLAAFADWDEFDVIHLITHGNGYAWITGQEVDWEQWKGDGMDARPEVRAEGLDITYLQVLNSESGEREKRWYYGVPADFFKAAYPGGLDGSVVLVTGCKTAEPQGHPPPPPLRALIGERTMVGGWFGYVNLAYGGPAAVAFTHWLARGYSGAETVRRLAEEELDISVDDPDALLSRYAYLRVYGPEGQYGKDLRIREIVSLLHPAPPPALGAERLALGSESPFHGLIRGVPGDGEPDGLSVGVEVEGVPDSEASSTHLWLELDGRRLGDPLPVKTGAREKDRWRFSLEDVPTGTDLQPGRTYELAAVVGTAEGSESRYAVEITERTCVPEVMADAVADDVVPGTLLGSSGDDAPRYLPSPSRLRVGGLVKDGGDACTHHLSSVGMLGSVLTSGRDPAVARDEMLRRFGDLTGDARDAADGDLPTRESSDPSTRSALGQVLGAFPSITGDDDGDAVIEVYSPHLLSWRSGMTSPIVTEHEGVGGWAPNASASVTVQLPGTAAAELREGESYPAAVLAPHGDVDRASLDVIPTAGPLYSRWTGERVARPRLTRSEGSRRSVSEQVAECERGKAQFRRQMAALGGMAELKPFFDRRMELTDCRYRGTAFSGTVESVYGRLSGTITVDEIAGGEVRGQLHLQGTGTLISERHRLVRNEYGKVLRSEAETSQREGPVSIEGSFSALAVHGGELRLMGNQTIALAPGAASDDRRAHLPPPDRTDEGSGPEEARKGPVLGPDGDPAEGGGTDGRQALDRPEEVGPVDGRTDYDRPDDAVLREAAREAERLRPRPLNSGEMRLEGSSSVILPTAEIALQLHCEASEPDELLFLLGREGDRGMISAERAAGRTGRAGGGGARSRIPVDLQLTLTGGDTPAIYEGAGTLILQEHDPGARRLVGRLEGPEMSSPLTREQASLNLHFEVDHACGVGAR